MSSLGLAVPTYKVLFQYFSRFAQLALIVLLTDEQH